MSGWTCVYGIDGWRAGAKDVLRLVVAKAFIHLEHAMPVNSRLHLLSIITDHRLILAIHLVISTLHAVVLGCRTLNIFIRYSSTAAKVVADLSGAIDLTGERASGTDITFERIWVPTVLVLRHVHNVPIECLAECLLRLWELARSNRDVDCLLIKHRGFLRFTVTFDISLGRNDCVELRIVSIRWLVIKPHLGVDGVLGEGWVPQWSVVKRMRGEGLILPVVLNSDLFLASLLTDSSTTDGVQRVVFLMLDDWAILALPWLRLATLR